MQNTHIFQPIQKGEALYNARAKLYPSADGKLYAQDVIIFERSTFNPHGFEPTTSRQEPRNIWEEAEDATDSRTLVRSARRAKQRAYDLIMSNPDMQMFVTLTLAPDKVDRANWDEVIRLLSVWLDNRVRRNGLKYVLVPEYHKDGAAIHFHGFMNEAALRLVPSGHYNRGKTVYNIADFPYGFTTAVRRGSEYVDSVRTAKYCYKYMVKAVEEGGGKIGGRYFLHGGKLDEPRYIYYNSDIFGERFSRYIASSIRTLDYGGRFVRLSLEGVETVSCLSSLLKGNERFCSIDGENGLDEVITKCGLTI